MEITFDPLKRIINAAAYHTPAEVNRFRANCPEHPAERIKLVPGMPGMDKPPYPREIHLQRGFCEEGCEFPVEFNEMPS